MTDCCLHLKLSVEKTVIIIILLLSLTHRNHHWTTKLTLPTIKLTAHSVTHTSESKEWENICSIWISTIGKKKKEKEKRVRRERSYVSDRLLWFCCVMCVQGGVFSQLTVSISHLTDTKLNWTEWTLDSSEQEKTRMLYVLCLGCPDYELKKYSDMVTPCPFSQL